MFQWIRRNITKIGLTLFVVVTLGMTSFIVTAIATAPRSDRSVTEISDTKMPEPGPGIGINGKFNPNLLGTTPGL